MKLTDYTFRDDVSFNEMLLMANNLVTSLYGNAESRLNMALGQEYLMFQAEMQLFTSYGVADADSDVEAFMQMIFAYGVDRFRDWLRDGAGKEKFTAFERMVERGAKLYMDMKPLDTLVDEVSRALHNLNQIMSDGGEMTPDKAVELLGMYLNEQKQQKEEASPAE